MSNKRKYKFIGKGGHAKTFLYGNEVLKICKISALRIPLYEWQSIATDLDYLENSARLLPARNINIRKGDRFFYYNMTFLPSGITNGDAKGAYFIKAEQAIQIIKLIQSLIMNGYIVRDIGLQNFRGDAQGQVWLIDYHDVEVISDGGVLSSKKDIVFSQISKCLYSLIHDRDITRVLVETSNTKKAQNLFNIGLTHELLSKENIFSVEILNKLKALESAATLQDNIKALNEIILLIRKIERTKKMNYQSALPLLQKAFFGTQGFSYQKAELTDGRLVPLDSSALKYNVIKNAAQLLPPGFSFCDFGCAHGLFGLLLLQDFENVKGTLINIDPSESAFISDLIAQLRLQQMSFSRKSCWEVKDSFDLTIYASLVHHLLRGCGDTGAVAGMIRAQTKQVAMVEIPDSKQDILAEKVLGENRHLLDDLLVALKKHFDIISQTPLIYNQEIKRNAFVLMVK